MSTLARAARWSRKLPPSRLKDRAGRAVTLALGFMGANAVGTMAMTDGTLLELDARSRTEATAFWSGSYEPQYQRLLIDLLERFGDSMYDVGANVGLIAVPIARHLGGRGQVTCFEPVPENCSRLRRNIALNGLTNCGVHEIALGAATGEIRIAREDSYRSTSGNAVIVNEAPNLRHYDAVSTVAMEPLDAVVRRFDLRLPNVIKLDVEGAEVGFLAGAGETLAEARPVILGEFNSALMPKFGMTFVDAAELLPPEYAIFGFAADATIVEKPAAVGVGDVLLVPRERVSDLPLRIAQ